MSRDRCARRAVHRLLAVLAAVTLTATGCGAGDSDTSGAPKEGGTLTMMVGVDTRSFDPALNQTMSPGAEASRLAAVYGTLFWRDVETGEVKPGIGKSIEPSDDGKVWTVKLRPNIKFTDGSPFNAEAVAYNWQRLGDPELRSPAYTLAKDPKFEAVDDLTVRITLPKPNFEFDKTVASAFTFIASAEALKKDPEGFGKKPVGAGPFKLERWVPGSETTFVRNENYWEKGKPHLDRLVIKPIPDATQAVETVISGGADLYTSTLNEITDRAKEAGLTTKTADSGGGNLNFFNVKRAPFNDVRARQAVSLAIDNGQLTKVMDPGQASKRATSLFAEESPYYDKSLQLPKQNRKRAQQLFNELAAEGKPVNFTFAGLAGSSYERAVQYIQAQLNQYDNVNMKIKTVDFASASETIYIKRDFDATIRPAIQAVTTPEPALSDTLETGGRTNVSGYSSPEMDAALAAGRAASTEQDRIEAYKKLQRIFLKDAPMWVFGNGDPNVIYRNHVTGVHMWEEGTVRFEEIALTE
ncbi:MAG: hypothetical protein GEU98_15160 [Pseudonocardiaceae bacterium]|nr:hypothetical protein [Pseudonocardiaceae bacterium]